jgi:hypothetical protein
MRYYPEDKYDRSEAKRLEAPQWMLDVLKVNPEYCGWGPHEDYMWKEGTGWDSRVIKNSWSDFGPWQLDDLNEIANFYFEIGRESKECPTCAGRFYHPDAQWISESFYSHSSPFKQQTAQDLRGKAIMAQFGGRESDPIHGYGSYPSVEMLSKYGPAFHAFCEEMRIHKCWHDRITQDEADALVEKGRLNDFTSKWTKEKGWQKNPDAIVTAETVNAANRPESRGHLGHDAINRGILIEARLERLGLPKDCPECNGHGHVWTADQPDLRLILWALHPRKGCSRGVEVKNIRREELPTIRAWLGEAAKRNQERFGKLDKIAARLPPIFAQSATHSIRADSPSSPGCCPDAYRGKA